MLKKIKKYSKYVIGMMIFLFVILPSMLGAYNIYQYVFLSKGIQEEVVISIDGHNITSYDISMHPTGLDKMVYIYNEIERVATEKIVNMLHIDVPYNEIDERYKNKVKQAKSRVKENINERELVRRVYGTSPYKLRDSIYEELKVDKVKNFLSDRDDLGKYKDILRKEIDKLDIKYIDESLLKYAPKRLFSLNSLCIMSQDFLPILLNFARYPMILEHIENSEKDPLKKAAKYLYSSIKQELFLADIAVSRGIEVESEGRDKIRDLADKLKEGIKSEIDTSDYYLKYYLKSNIDKYVEKERAYVDVIYIPFKPSKRDIELSESIANKTLDLAIKSNELPKKMKLKSLDKKIFSNRYNKRYFRSNEVVPNLISDTKSKIIAKDAGDKIEYVEFVAEISKETREDILNRAEDIKNKIENQEMTFDKAREIFSDINFKKEITIYRDNKFNKDLENSVMKNEDLTKLVTEEGVYIFKRKKYYAYKKPTLDEVRDRVEREYREYKLTEELALLIKRHSAKNKIQILDEYVEELIK